MSTEDAIFEVVKNITTNLDKRNKCLAIFLDLKKAFDTVSHKILLCKLDHIGIRGIPYNLLKSYLFQRKQKVNIDDQFSTTNFGQYGVPQGTVLGPLLFLIYLNDLLFLNIEGTIISYADDTVLLFNSTSWPKVIEFANEGMYTVSNWLSSNYLTLNGGKCKFITFSLRANTQPTEPKIKIHKRDCATLNRDCKCEVEIEHVSSIRYLGVILDQHLKWDLHRDTMIKRLRKLIYIFLTTRQFLSFKVLKILYFTLAEPIIKYGIISWGGSYQNVLNSLEIMQKTIIKIISKRSKLYSSKQLFNETKFLNIRQLYLKSILIFYYKNPSQLKYINHCYETKSKTNYNVRALLTKTTLGQHFMLYSGIETYNNLPNKYKKIGSVKLFSKKINKYIRTLS